MAIKDMIDNELHSVTAALATHVMMEHDGELRISRDQLAVFRLHMTYDVDVQTQEVVIRVSNPDEVLA